MPRQRQVPDIVAALPDFDEELQAFLDMVRGRNTLNVIGIDQSLSQSGFARLQFSVGSGEVLLQHLGRVETKSAKGINANRGLAVIHGIHDLIEKSGANPDVVVIEVPTYGSYRSESIYMLYGMLFQHLRTEWDIPLILTLFPTQLKMWVAGVATRFDIMEKDLKKRSKAVFSKMFPTAKCSGRKLSHDEAEAALLGFMGIRFIRVLLSPGMKLLPGEHKLFFSERKAKNTERNGIVFRNGEIFYLQPSLPVKTVVRERAQQEVLVWSN